MKCVSCGSSKMARSRIRPYDVKHALLLLFPVRCHECMGRNYINFFRWILLPSGKRRSSRHNGDALAAK